MKIYHILILLTSVLFMLETNVAFSQIQISENCLYTVMADRDGLFSSKCEVLSRLVKQTIATDAWFEEVNVADVGVTPKYSVAGMKELVEFKITGVLIDQQEPGFVKFRIWWLNHEGSYMISKIPITVLPYQGSND